MVRQGTYLVVRQGTYLVVREGGSTSRQDDGGEVEGDQEKVTLRHFRVLHPEALLEVLEHEGDEDVESLAHALEHDEAQRDARDGVEHAEDLAAHRLRGTVAVTFEEEKQRARYNSLSLRFYVYFIQTHKRFKRTLFIRTKQNMLKSPVYIIVEIVIQRGVLTLAGEIRRCGNARLLLQKLLH